MQEIQAASQSFTHDKFYQLTPTNGNTTRNRALSPSTLYRFSLLFKPQTFKHQENCHLCSHLGCCCSCHSELKTQAGIACVSRYLLMLQVCCACCCDSENISLRNMTTRRPAAILFSPIPVILSWVLSENKSSCKFAGAPSFFPTAGKIKPSPPKKHHKIHMENYPCFLLLLV